MRPHAQSSFFETPILKRFHDDLDRLRLDILRGQPFLWQVHVKRSAGSSTSDDQTSAEQHCDDESVTSCDLSHKRLPALSRLFRRGRPSVPKLKIRDKYEAKGEWRPDKSRNILGISTLLLSLAQRRSLSPHAPALTSLVAHAPFAPIRDVLR